MFIIPENTSKLRLALIGCNIDHSLSPKVYEEILGEKLECYDLLDYSSSDSIPPMRQLFEKYHGISITAPYKKIHKWIGDFRVEGVPEAFTSFNALKKSGNTVIATNTDFLALREIISDLLKGNWSQVFILGDGSMSEVVATILKDKGVAFTVLSRRNGLLDNYKFTTSKTLVFNTCSRSYLFTSPLPDESLFYDLNYSNSKQKESITSQNRAYNDGLKLLKMQAIEAVNFFTLK
jgi:shikimate 5-dehydrogenase